ncbi:AraC family transcriptional regulator [Frateuria sp. Soil773]|uniref:AraC family transcriptional regulator n=1 Tax=Frateuria sp. Soil773 TaxID=1736407 RepID=UPI0006F2A6C8|nr:helix-turn-helix transcriptional regulator [Frateuria sp. Soil773]KRE89158.1 AraC family transcriptional regulator [Frateuria sp. Soil773]
MDQNTFRPDRVGEIASKHIDYHNAHRPMAAMEVDWPDGSSTGRHSHSRGQLLYAITGVMVVESPIATWVVPPSRALWLAADMEHDVRMFGEVRMRTVFIDATQVSGVPDQSCVIHVSPLLRELIVAAASVPLDYLPDGREELLMRLLIEELRVSDVLPLHLPLPLDPRIRLVCETLIASPSETSTVADWSRRLGIAEKTIHRLFVKQTGMTFAQWREQARLVFALRRLGAGDRVIDIAFDCGYASQSAFTAMFRRHFGVTPSAFFEEVADSGK